ncbi:hypothetical protein EC608_002880 [Streptomyces malaysiensis subsp. malaysiensis]|nr:hypothetical protein [Streptomyces malaysiensis]
MKELVRAAAVQAEPVWFDASGTTGKTIALIEEAARGGAEIVAFPEVWIPGYPAFMVFAGEAELPLVAEYRANAVSIDGPELGAIRHAAAENHIMVGLGFAERAGRSLYMSQAVISNTGELRIARRKLKPTHRERALYGQGDGSDLQVIDTPLGRVGALMCWEHLQPFNKMAMIAEGEQIHISSWPMLDFFGANMMSSEAITTVNRAYAMESGTLQPPRRVPLHDRSHPAPLRGVPGRCSGAIERTDIRGSHRGGRPGRGDRTGRLSRFSPARPSAQAERRARCWRRQALGVTWCVLLNARTNVEKSPKPHSAAIVLNNRSVCSISCRARRSRAERIRSAGVAPMLAKVLWTRRVETLKWPASADTSSPGSEQCRSIWCCIRPSSAE